MVNILGVKELLDRLNRPSGVSDEAALEKAAAMIHRALENNLTSVEVFRFPNLICTDNGRAINQAEAGWESTLTGIADYVGGMPGDVIVTLSWD